MGEGFAFFYFQLVRFRIPWPVGGPLTHGWGCELCRRDWRKLNP